METSETNKQIKDVQIQASRPIEPSSGRLTLTPKLKNI